jgi:peptidoglycan endopeptidase LytE
MRRYITATLAVAFGALLASFTSAAYADTTYTVRRGDSVWAIAKRFDVGYLAVLRANRLSEDAIIHPGQKLVVPGVASPEAEGEAEEAAEPLVYVVQKGDTLWEIAQRHGTSVEALAQSNGLQPEDVLLVGISLRIPEGSEDQGQHRFVESALEYRGVRYRYGGVTTRGMDCSGLVVRVLQNYDIDAPHNSKALYKLGAPVSRENLQPGDLVFFHTTRPGISHVGIYIGDGEFIHASSRKGRVRVERLDEGYYHQRFVGARRIK